MLGMLMPLAVMLATAFAGSAHAAGQEKGAPPPPPTTELTILGKPLRATDGKIYINADCEIFPGLVFPATDKKKPQGEFNADICHLEKVLNSEHHEEKPVGGELKSADVEVRERDYVLQNITLQPQIFAILDKIPEGWEVSSDPKPVDMAGDLAIFEVHAGPGAIVRLHVGIRHTKDVKDKALPPAPGKP